MNLIKINGRVLVTFNRNRKLRDLSDVYGNIEEVSRLGPLRIWILQVIDKGPKNGVEIMDAIHELHEQVHHMRGEIIMHPLNHGPITSRRPLPGSIYPMLKKMVKEELIIKQEDGRYKLTENGQKTIYNIIGTTDIDRYNGDNAIENAINEIDNYSSFLEDVKTKKLQTYEKQINELSDRLQKLKKSLHKRI